MAEPSHEREKAVQKGMETIEWTNVGTSAVRRNRAPEPEPAAKPAAAFPRRRRVYMSSALGFSESGKYAMDRIRAELEALGADVWEPFRECAGMSPRAAGRRRLAGIRECDGVFAVVNGNPPDAGVMVEIGYAFAHDKQVFLFRDDSRICADAPALPLDMVTCAVLPDDWNTHWYTGVGELDDPNKALVRWLDG